MSRPKIIKTMLKLDPSKKYDEILKQQEALNQHINEIGHEGYQRLFVAKTEENGARPWVMIFLIITALVAIIASLPINWELLFQG